jgi:methylaspartate ammonia-lyase
MKVFIVTQIFDCSRMYSNDIVEVYEVFQNYADAVAYCNSRKVERYVSYEINEWEVK